MTLLRVFGPPVVSQVQHGENQQQKICHKENDSLSPQHFHYDSRLDDYFRSMMCCEFSVMNSIIVHRCRKAKLCKLFPSHLLLEDRAALATRSHEMSNSVKDLKCDYIVLQANCLNRDMLLWSADMYSASTPSTVDVLTI